MAGACLYDGLEGGVEKGVEKGVWYDFVHRIKWSNVDQGRHEIWMRKANGPVMKVLHQTGINTLYTSPGTVLLKVGLYHGPLLGHSTSVVHDRIRSSYLPGTAGADAVRIMAGAGVEEFRIDFTLAPDALGPGPFDPNNPATKRACRNVEVKTCHEASCSTNP
jgi:hypothetical protein